MKTIKASGDSVLDFSSNQSALDLNALAKGLHLTNGMPRYIGFAQYAAKHQSSDVVRADAVTLEYGVQQRPALEARIAELGWNALVFNTERAKGDYLNTVTVVVALETPITADPATWLGLNSAGDAYTRAATLVARELDVYCLADGQSNTFLVQPISYPKAVWFDGKPLNRFFLGQAGFFKIDDWKHVNGLGSYISSIEADTAALAANRKTRTISSAEFVREINAKKASKATFDDLFDTLEHSTDEVIVSAAKLKAQLTDLRKQMEGQQ